MEDQEVETKEEAETAIHTEARRVHCSHGNQNEGRMVRIRPRVSIVRAVRLLTEARKQGVELWMKRCDQMQWLCVDLEGEPLEAYQTTPVIWHGTEFNHVDVLARWIVVTPDDARRIDAKRVGSEALLLHLTAYSRRR
jgi:hypothetical protein